MDLKRVRPLAHGRFMIPMIPTSRNAPRQTQSRIGHHPDAFLRSEVEDSVGHNTNKTLN